MIHPKHLSASLLLICLVRADIINAQEHQKLNIEQATVFLSGAELTSTANLTLAKGDNEILFTNVAGDVNSQSITINATHGVVIESATFQNNYLAEQVFSPRATAIKDSIEIMSELRQEVKTRIDVFAEQIAILHANKKVGGDNTGLSVAELMKILDLVNTRMETTLNQQQKQQAVLAKMDERIVRLTQQLDEEQKKGYQPGGQLLVKFYAKDATNTAITVNYIMPNAGWAPAYDIFADELNQPVKLYYKANIYQNSGVKWNNVRLSLSTGNPNEGAQAPAMNPWQLAFYVPEPRRTLTGDEISRVPTNDLSDMVGLKPGLYQSQRGSDMNIGGARTSGTQYIIDGVQVQNTSMNQYVSVDNSGVNVSFDIDLPYTIPSDGQQHMVAIKKYELPATYRYYSVPKLDKDAFLQAQITNWEDLDLLPGQTNIFYEGTYVGQGLIDVRNVKDTMILSLGRDKKIVVKRDRDTKLRSVKTVGTNVRETFAYTISIRNTRKDKINLIIEDQQPVSNDKDIVIEGQETGASVYNDTTGIMKWDLAINGSETKNLSFGYTVRYPKSKTVMNLR